MYIRFTQTGNYLGIDFKAGEIKFITQYQRMIAAGYGVAVTEDDFAEYQAGINAPDIVDAGPSSTGATAKEIIASYNIAKDNNPHYNDVMPSPPTVTVPGATITSGFTDYIISDVTGLKNVAMNFYGGVLTGKLTYFAGFPVSTFISGGNFSTTQNSLAWRVAFWTDAPLVDIGVYGGAGAYYYRIIVDGKYVSKTGVAPAGGGRQYIRVDFSSVVKPRLIQLEGYTANMFYSVGISPLYKIWKPAQAKKMIVVGDSFVEGTQATYPGDGLAFVAADYLGIENCFMSGAGGTGYTNNGGAGKYTLIQRKNDWILQSPDLLVFAAGINDADDAALQPAVLALLQETRLALYNVPIIVLGVWGVGGPTAAIISKENKIAAAVTQFADSKTVFIPISTDPLGAWVTGTGKVGATTGVGNSDVVTSTDGTHPSPYGHLYYGERIATAIANALKTISA